MPHTEIARAKSTLTSLGATFEAFDVKFDRTRFEEMHRRSNRRTVLQIFIDNHHAGDSDDLEAAHNSGELKKLFTGNRQQPEDHNSNDLNQPTPFN